MKETVHLGDNIRAIRELKGIKQETFAEMMGVTQAAISKLESTEKIDDERLKDIAEKLERAKDLAVSQSKDVSVLFDAKENKYGIDRNGNGRLESAELEEMPEGITLSQDGLVTFSRSGKPTKDSKEPSIVIRNTRDSKRVSVSSLGAVEIE